MTSYHTFVYIPRIKKCYIISYILSLCLCKGTRENKIIPLPRLMCLHFVQFLSKIQLVFHFLVHKTFRKNQYRPPADVKFIQLCNSKLFNQKKQDVHSNFYIGSSEGRKFKS